MPIKINEGFGVLVMDPPWLYDNEQDHNPARGGTPYVPMSLEDLCGLKPLVDQVVAKDSMLFMWATFPKLREALHLMEALGYTYVTVAFTWVKLNAKGYTIVPKTNMVLVGDDGNSGFALGQKDLILKGGVRSGQGYYTNANAEIVLLGKRGRTAQLRQAKDVKQVVFEPEVVVAPITTHSAKPEEVRNRIEALTGGIPGLELFARPPGRVPGWVKLGWEIDNEDIRVMLQRLIDGQYSRPPKDTQ